MLNVALMIAFACLGVAMLLNLWRMLVGPDLPDRILALDTLYINAVAMIVLGCIYLNTKVYFEAALLIALLGFVGTVALSKYIARGDIL